MRCRLSFSASHRVLGAHDDALTLSFCRSVAFNLDFYTDVLDLRYLLDRLDDPSDDITADASAAVLDVPVTRQPSALQERFRRMNSALIDVIEDFSLVSFVPLQIEDGASLQKLIQAIDKANGFVFTSVDWNTAVVKDYAFGDQFATVADIQERFIDPPSADDALQHELERVARS